MAEHLVISKQINNTAGSNATLAYDTNNNGTSQTSSTYKFHLVAKRKLEKLKNKFAEFFFQTSSTTTSNSNNTSSSNSTSSNSTISSSNTSINSSNKQIECVTVQNLTYIPHNSFLFSNVKNLKRFNNLYQQNIDDEDLQVNLFDKTFMIDYIAFKLVNELKQSQLVNQLHLDIRIPYYKNDFNLIFEISKQIYQITEHEPMGLKGLHVTIELELNDRQQQQCNNNNNNRTQTISKFRFDNSSSLTTFDLRIVLKEDENIFCLRNLLPKTKLFNKLRIQSAIYLDYKYNLVKHKLY